MKKQKVTKKQPKTPEEIHQLIIKREAKKVENDLNHVLDRIKDNPNEYMS